MALRFPGPSVLRSPRLLSPRTRHITPRLAQAPSSSHPKSLALLSSRSIATSSSRALAQPALASQPFEHQHDTSSDMPAPVRTEAEWADFGRQHVAHGLGRLKDIVTVKGQGANLWTSEGRKFLDFTSGIGVTNLGHCHPAVTAAVQRQAETLVHLQCSITFSAPYLQLIERLLPVMPHPSLDSFFFWNSGSEAVEAAVKVARLATKKQNIITMQGSYHGRTAGASALTRSKTIYSQGTMPLMGGVYSTPFPYWHSLGLPPSTSEADLISVALTGRISAGVPGTKTVNGGIK